MSAKESGALQEWNLGSSDDPSIARQSQHAPPPKAAALVLLQGVNAEVQKARKATMKAQKAEKAAGAKPATAKKAKASTTKKATDSAAKKAKEKDVKESAKEKDKKDREAAKAKSKMEWAARKKKEEAALAALNVELHACSKIYEDADQVEEHYNANTNSNCLDSDIVFTPPASVKWMKAWRALQQRRKDARYGEARLKDCNCQTATDVQARENTPVTLSDWIAGQEGLDRN